MKSSVNTENYVCRCRKKVFSESGPGIQMISFEFLRAASIGWTISHSKLLVHMIDPERVIGQQLVSYDLFLILWCLLWYEKSTRSNELNSPNYWILFSMVFELFLCGFDGYIYILSMLLYILIVCHTMWILTHAFFAETFQQMNATRTFQIGLNDCTRAIRWKFTFAGAWESFHWIRTKYKSMREKRLMDDV